MASFTVTSVNEHTALDGAGQLVQQVDITIKTTMGARGSLSLTSDQFQAFTSTPEGKAALQAMLSEKSDQLDAPFAM